MIWEISSARSCMAFPWRSFLRLQFGSVRQQRVAELVELGADRPVDDRVPEARHTPADERGVLPLLDDNASPRHLLELGLEARVVGVAQTGRGDDLGAKDPLAQVAHLAQ